MNSNLWIKRMITIGMTIALAVALMPIVSPASAATQTVGLAANQTYHTATGS